MTRCSEKKFLRKFIVASVAVGALTFALEIYDLPIGTAVVHAEIKQYVGVGESIVSDRETLELGKEGAKLQAIRNAQKQAGLFIGSHSVVKNHELDTDEVVAFTAGIVKVGNVSYEPVPVEQWIKYRATVVVTLDTDDLTNQINAWLGINAQDRSTITEQTKALNGTLDMIQIRTVELETTVAGATATVDSAQVQEELKQIDRDILYAQKISEGNELMRKGDRAGAMKSYQEAIALYPKDATIAYEKLGDGYLEAKDYARAIDAYTKVIQMDPNYSVPYFKRGKIYFDQKDYRKAAADFEKVLAIAPSSGEVRWNCILAYVYLGEYDTACECMKKGPHPGYIRLDYIRISGHYTELIKADYHPAENYFKRGVALEMLSKESGNLFNRSIIASLANVDFKKAAELDPTYKTSNLGIYHYERGEVYSEMKYDSSALKNYERAIKEELPSELRKKINGRIQRLKKKTAK